MTDDASRDDSALIAVRAGASVLRQPSSRGPGAARNRAVAAALHPLVLLVDADVVVEPGALALALDALAPGCGGVQGVYTADSEDLSAAGSYKHGSQLENIARLGRGPVSVLGSSLALVRREALLAAGGFPETLAAASVEDRLLGARLAEGGAPLLLEPAFRGRHLHDYDLAGLLRTDFTRARDEVLHWGRLGAARGYVHPRKKAGYAAYLAGGALAAASFPLAGAGLIAAAVAADVAAVAAATGRLRWAWPLVSLLDHAAVLAGAATGAAASLRRGPREPAAAGAQAVL